MNVYLLGAGASAEAGVPTSAQLISVAYQIYQRMLADEPLLPGLADELAGSGPDLGAGPDRFGAARDSLGRLFAFIADYFHGGRLDPVLFPSANHVLSTVDLHLQQGTSLWLAADRHLGRVELLELRRSVVLAILLALEHFGGFAPPATSNPYRPFIARLGPDDVVVSLNQDYLLDQALWAAGIVPDYGLPERSLSREVVGGGWARRMRLFKPHGSINWLRCPSCERLMILRNAGGIRSLELLAGGAAHGEEAARMRCPVDGQLGEPVVIPPTVYKQMNDPLLIHLLSAAGEALREADQLVIVGCSLQESDTHLITWLKGNLAQRARPPRVAVVNADDAVIGHYRRLFGPDRLEAYWGRFSAFLREPAEEGPIAAPGAAPSAAPHPAS